MQRRQINQIKAGAVVSYITIFFNIISGFIYTPWLIRQLGQSDYALYSLVLSVMTYFVLDFGMGAAITRFVARFRASGQEHRVKDLLGITVKLYLILDAVIMIALVIAYLFLDNIYVNLTPDELEKFKVIFVIAGSMSVLSFPFLPQNGVFTAYERLYALKMFDLIAKIVTVATIVISLLMGGGLYVVVFFNAFVTFAMHLMKFIYITRAEHLRINFRYHDRGMVKSIFGFSVWVTLATIADRFFFTFIPSLLGIVSNSVQISIFSVAVSVENYVSLFASAFNNLFLPRVNAMVTHKESTEKITDLMIKVGRLQLLVVGTLIVGLTSMGHEFILCWVGKDYEQSYIVLVLFLIPSIVHFTQGIANEMIYATNNVKYRALVYILGSIISIVTTVVLAPRYGAIGAGVGIFLAILLSHVFLMNYIYYKKLYLNVWRYFKECHFAMYIQFIVSGIIGFVIMKVCPVNSLLLFIIKGCIWGVIHLIITWFTILNDYEKDLFTGFIKRFLHKTIIKKERK